MRQVKPIEQWPSGEGRVVATVCKEPAQLAKALGPKFERGVDGLDWYSIAAIADEAVGQIWFFNHDHGPAALTSRLTQVWRRQRRRSRSGGS